MNTIASFLVISCVFFFSAPPAASQMHVPHSVERTNPDLRLFCWRSKICATIGETGIQVNKTFYRDDGTLYLLLSLPNDVYNSSQDRLGSFQMVALENIKLLNFNHTFTYNVRRIDINTQNNADFFFSRGFFLTKDEVISDNNFIRQYYSYFLPTSNQGGSRTFSKVRFQFSSGGQVNWTPQDAEDPQQLNSTDGQHNLSDEWQLESLIRSLQSTGTWQSEGHPMYSEELIFRDRFVQGNGQSRIKHIASVYLPEELARIYELKMIYLEYHEANAVSWSQRRILAVRRSPPQGSNEWFNGWDSSRTNFPFDQNLVGAASLPTVVKDLTRRFFHLVEFFRNGTYQVVRISYQYSDAPDVNSRPILTSVDLLISANQSAGLYNFLGCERSLIRNNLALLSIPIQSTYNCQRSYVNHSLLATEVDCSLQSSTSMPHQFLRTDTTVNMSGNHLTSISDHELAQKGFSSNIVELDFSYNPQLATIQRNAFAGTNILNLRRLNLAHCGFTSPPRGALRGLRDDLTRVFIITELILDYNSFTGRFGLMGVDVVHLRCRHCNLSDSHFEPERGFDDWLHGSSLHISHMETLDFSHNNLQHLPMPMNSAHLRALHTLNLSNNRLVQIDPLFWARNRIQTTIDLSHNRITNITVDMVPANEWSGERPRMQRIDLSHNPFTDENLNSIGHVSSSSPGVEAILRNCSLTNVPRVFATNSQTRSIDLAHNRITRIEEGAFYFFPDSKLESIDLSHNPLQTLLFMDTFIHMPRLSRLDLSHTEISDFDFTGFVSGRVVRDPPVSINIADTSAQECSCRKFNNLRAFVMIYRRLPTNRRPPMPTCRYNNRDKMDSWDALIMRSNPEEAQYLKTCQNSLPSNQESSELTLGNRFVFALTVVILALFAAGFFFVLVYLKKTKN